MKFNNFFSKPSYSLATLALFSCEKITQSETELSHLDSQPNSDVFNDSPIDQETHTIPQDPAYGLSHSQIYELYSQSSCDSLNTYDLNSLANGPLSDAVNDGLLPDYQRGIRGRVYTPDEGFNPKEWYHLSRYHQEDVIKLPNPLYFFQLNVPTRPFDQGFPLFDGSLLENASGETLVEFFRIHFDGYIELSDQDPEGEYEIALISDDGAFLDINQQSIISHPSYTPSKLMCGTQSVMFERGKPKSFELSWFQGPRLHIAVMMLWRPKSNQADPECGKAGNNRWFDFTSTPSVKKQAFIDLEDRGWKVIDIKNFRLPQNEAFNPCLSKRVLESLTQ